jgi:hypothetical protein
MLQCYCLEGIGRVCEGFITARGRKKPSGSQKASGAGTRAVTGLRNRAATIRNRVGRGVQVSKDTGKFPDGKAGAKSGRLSGGGPANWDGEPSGEPEQEGVRDVSQGTMRRPRLSP